MSIGDKKPVVMESDLAVPGGVATLGKDGILDESQRPGIGGIAGLENILLQKQGKLTGNPGQLIGIGEDGTAKATMYPCNQNLLINWDFTNPVNRNGKITYTHTDNSVREYTIDRWEADPLGILTITAQGITMLKSPEQQGFNLTQFIDNPQSLAGKQVTFSALIGGNTNIVLRVDNGYPTMKSHTGSGAGVVSVTYTLPNAVSTLGVIIQSVDDDGPAIFIASKLELGNTQTLAHQDEDGKWVLNEIPNYAEQYAICSQYCPITGEFIGSQHSNPNLLINSYFVGGGSQQGDGRFPINQRGKTEYENSKAEYKIDQWTGNTGSSKVILKDDCITITQSDSIHWFGQFIEVGNMASFLGKTYTLSVLLKDGSLHYGSVTPTVNSGNYDAFELNGGKVYLQFVWGEHKFLFALNSVAKNGDISIIAAKLELGPIQTLAHKEGDTWVLNDPPPNYALELAKCQRYQLIINSNIRQTVPTIANFVGTGFASSAKQARIFLPLPQTLRAIPTITFHGYIYVSSGSNERQVTGIEVAWGYTANGISLLCTTADELSTGNPYVLRILSDASIIIDANL